MVHLHLLLCALTVHLLVAKLSDKIQNALDETRMLVLGIQVLLGLNLKATFEPGFARLTELARDLKLVSLGLLLLAFGVIVAPAARHRLLDRGEDSASLHRFTVHATAFGLLPFATALGIDLFVAGAMTSSYVCGAASGITATAVALAAWYGVPWLSRHGGPSSKEANVEPAKLDEKVRHVLTEARVVLPGTQALLGFQLITVFLEAFEKIPAAQKALHLASLGAVALTVVLLMLPAAYHRIAEDGEATERMHGVASRCVVAAMALLALGLSGELAVVIVHVTGSVVAAAASAAVTFLVLSIAWFGWALLRRRKDARLLSTAGRTPQRHRD